MSRETIYLCDVCKKPKGEANHWYVIHSDRNNIEITVWDIVYLIAQVVAQNRADAIHVCGESCLNKWLSVNLPKLYTKEKENENANTSNKHGNSL